MREAFKKKFSIFITSFAEYLEELIPQKPFFSTEEVAEIFGVRPKTVRKWIYSGKVRATKLGTQWRIPRNELIEFAANNNSWLIE
ncbi:helix-turn-helix domain-containing protein [Balnearium lithotrophicum]|uniref:helix-turn-helix domain-containing protein n=1 Tax=Balnearium lithotrophicum TaxID=223788 RepID=UPI001FE4E24E|nr:helix-turn-helix domain-containing protein [Balnearium lithotrophicum]